MNRTVKENSNEIQKHFISLLLLQEKPEGWFNEVIAHMNLLHRTSFYLGNIYSTIRNEINNGFNSDGVILDLRNLLSVVCAKQDVAPKASKAQKNKILGEMAINEKNKLRIDKIIASRKQEKLYDFLNKKDRRKRGR